MNEKLPNYFQITEKSLELFIKVTKSSPNDRKITKLIQNDRKAIKPILKWRKVTESIPSLKSYWNYSEYEKSY